MGSFNTICAVTRQIVTVGEAVKLIPISSFSMSRGHISADAGCYISSRYRVFNALPLTGTYDDYGRFDIKRDIAFEIFKNHLQQEFHSCGGNEDYKNIQTKDLFEDSEVFADMINEGCMYVHASYGAESLLQFMVIKESVYNKMVELYKDIHIPSYVQNYITQNNEEINSILDAAITPKIDLEAEIDKISDMLENITDPKERKELTRKLSKLIHKEMGLSISGFGDGLFGSGESSYFGIKSFSSDNKKLLSSVRDEFFKFKDALFVMKELNIEFSPQMYGSQDNDNFTHTRIMNKLQIAGFNNHEYDEDCKIQEQDLVVVVDCDYLTSCTKPNYKNEVDLIFNEDGSYTITDTEYNSLRSFKFKDVKIIADI